MVSCVFVVFNDLYKKRHKASSDKEQIGAKTGPKRDDYWNSNAKFAQKWSNLIEPILHSCHPDTINPGMGIEPTLGNRVIRSGGDTIFGVDDKEGIVELFRLSTKKKLFFLCA